jgi:hypothetical protein
VCSLKEVEGHRGSVQLVADAAAVSGVEVGP